MDHDLPDEHTLPALYLIWPSASLASPPQVSLPPGYELRPYRAGDEEPLRSLRGEEGWKLSHEDWQGYRSRVIPRGLFAVWNAASQMPVGTAGAIHSPGGARHYFPSGGQLAYLVVHPDHRGHGPGMALTTLVVERFLRTGYEQIWTGVQRFRLPAIKTYLKAGFVPFLHQDGLGERWKRICAQIGWPYTPDLWPTALFRGLNLSSTSTNPRERGSSEPA